MSETPKADPWKDVDIQMDLLVEKYNFQCEGGPLHNCRDWLKIGDLIVAARAADAESHRAALEAKDVEIAAAKAEHFGHRPSLNCTCMACRFDEARSQATAWRLEHNARAGAVVALTELTNALRAEHDALKARADAADAVVKLLREKLESMRKFYDGEPWESLRAAEAENVRLREEIQRCYDAETWLISEAPSAVHGPNVGNKSLDACSLEGHDPVADHAGRLWSLWDMERFYAGALSIMVGRLERAWNALNTATIPANHPLGWTAEAAWTEVDAILEHVRGVLAEHNFPSALLRQVDRAIHSCGSRNPSYAIGIMQELSASIVDELSSRVYFMIDTAETDHIQHPLARFGIAATVFATAEPSMISASKCYAFDQWDATVFHSMRVLEHGLRWLAGRINAGPFPLTLREPLELAQWGNIIDNIQGRINDELGPPPKGSGPRPPKTAERDAELSFYSQAAKEFTYFKSAWRNHVMHDRNDPYGKGTAGDVLEHVAAFMKALAARHA